MTKSILGFIVGIALCLGIVAAVGESPWLVLKVLFTSGFGSAYDFGQVLYYATSLILTGLAVFIPLRAGLFNIGAEGQLTMGALAMTAVGLYARQTPAFFAPLLALAFGIFVSGLWGFIPGILKTKRGSHEVILTMMLNFVAAGIANYLITGPMQSSSSQNPETDSVAEVFRFQNWDPIHLWSPDSPANMSFLVAVLLCFAVWFWSRKAVSGFEQKVSGYGPEISATAGLDAKKYQLWSMTIAGALAGLVGMNEILGAAGKFRLGFSPDLGFMGIAVALLARGNALGVLPAAVLFAVLQKGASDLDLETQTITRDFARILQAVIILSVIAFQSKGKKNE